MLPIFSELLKMWADLGYELPIEEGRYWLDNNFILGFTHDGNLVKLYKYKVDDDLNISLKPYDDKMKSLIYCAVLLDISAAATSSFSLLLSECLTRTAGFGGFCQLARTVSAIVLYCFGNFFVGCIVGVFDNL